MTITDPIADMLTIIRNANREQKKQATFYRSKIKVGICEVLKREGFIKEFESFDKDSRQYVTVTLKYGEDGEFIMKEIKRESKPGRRVYRGMEEVTKVMNGYGIGIYSTSHGILSDRECREKRTGGEYLCSII